MKRVQKHLNTIRKNGYTEAEVESYSCSLCKDKEFIINGNMASPCQCKQRKDYERILERSGISQAFRKKTFSSFTTAGKPAIIPAAKAMAEDYVKKFHAIREERHSSMALLGQVGSGKTHLAIAAANALMEENIGVLYMQYREAMTSLKQNMLDEVYYQREVGRFKKAAVLLIDDLYKGKISSTDHNIMFEIINYRYLNNAPILLSSEYTVDALLEFDEAIGSRLIEMCRGRIIEFEGGELNHRLVV